MDMHPIRISRSVARGFALATLWVLVTAALAQPLPPQSHAAQPQADPPARVAAVTSVEGSVVFAPAGETEWVDLPRNRPITKGDRLWTDDGGRAEVHFGSSVLQLDARTFVEVVAIEDDVVQLSVNEGTVNARARELRAGDNFEISTPQLALRATQPGDWRIDVDPQQGFTRVTAHGGAAVLYGAGGNVQQITAGQQMAFTGRDLALANVPPAVDDGFERWAMERNRAEDQSIAARYVPRDVVAYPELDSYGTWSSDPSYGTVWYPQVAAADWAPYRYGHWDFIAPWGWTWIDDAPWGFAPFHYGRWAVIGSRWAWVPGPLGRHPVYAPALVAFVGGIGSGPSVGWYPLAPGEIWQPYWNASPVYVRNVNRYLVTDSRRYHMGTHLFMRRPDAITTVRIDDFHRGRAVNAHWQRVHAQDVARVQPTSPPAPLREARRDFPREQARIVQQQRQSAPQRFAPPQERFLQPAAPRPQPNWRGGEEGGYSRFMRPQQQERQQFVQQRQEPRQAQRQEQRQQFVQQREQRQAVQAQRVEAIRQQQAAREVQRPQAWMQQPQHVQQPHAATAQQRHDERTQRQAQHDEGRGHGRRFE